MSSPLPPNRLSTCRAMAGSLYPQAWHQQSLITSVSCERCIHEHVSVHVSDELDYFSWKPRIRPQIVGRWCPPGSTTFCSSDSQELEFTSYQKQVTTPLLLPAGRGTATGTPEHALVRPLGRTWSLLGNCLSASSLGRDGVGGPEGRSRGRASCCQGLQRAQPPGQEAIHTRM